jgi:hypothetical protein
MTAYFIARQVQEEPKPTPIRGAREGMSPNQVPNKAPNIAQRNNL